MIKGAIFDCDGTLLDTMPLWRDAAGRYLETLGVHVDECLGARFFEMTLPESAQLIREDFGLKKTVSEITHGIKDAVYLGYLEEVQLKPGARDFLNALVEADVPMAVVSSGSEALIRPAFARLGIEDMFAGYFASTETGLHKRQPAMFHHAAELMESAPGDTWVFEDAVYAVRVANEAGFHTIGIADEASRAHSDVLSAETEAYWEEYPTGIPDFMLD
ncbi:HAD family phosphatase [Mobiluncus sp.]|uniref:HAD family hydrolase n=1 Tax=Mobiluncus sp. TaxID=47293 RepID=UPI002A917D4A|nr:HAD family phosphatase [Mobiluncus sp.]MDY6077699.1 HAD family phosphatase [Mobiluncus sp.]